MDSVATTSVTPPPKESPPAPVKPTEEPPAKIISPPKKLITLKKLEAGSSGLISGNSPIIKKIGIIRPKDSSTIDFKLIVNNKNAVSNKFYLKKK